MLAKGITVSWQRVLLLIAVLIIILYPYKSSFLKGFTPL